jgi:hypothetical protein
MICEGQSGFCKGEANRSICPRSYRIPAKQIENSARDPCAERPDLPLFFRLARQQLAPFFLAVICDAAGLRGKKVVAQPVLRGHRCV